MRTGTVISATMRSSDLLLAFRDELSDILDESGTNSHSYPFGRLVAEASVLAGFPEFELNYGSKAEEASEIIGELMDALDMEAPEGYYFGAHPDDGADYGFWIVDR